MQEAQTAVEVATNPFMTQVTVSAIVVWLFKKLKETTWFPFLSESTARWAQTAWGVVAAFLSAAGIHFTYDGTAGTLLVTGLLQAGIVTALWEAAQQFVMQQLIYHGVVQPNAPSPSAVVDAAIKEVKANQ